MRALIVAHAGPFVGPSASATRTFVEVEKPGHANLLGSQTIISPRHEINKSAVAKILKLLPDLGFDVLVGGIEITQMPLESIHLVEREPGVLRHPTSSSTHPGARVHRRSSAGQGRIRGRIGGRRLAGRFWCRWRVRLR